MLVYHAILGGVWCGRVRGAIQLKNAVVGMYNIVSVLKLIVDIECEWSAPAKQCDAPKVIHIGRVPRGTQRG